MLLVTAFHYSLSRRSHEVMTESVQQHRKPKSPWVVIAVLTIICTSISTFGLYLLMGRTKEPSTGIVPDAIASQEGATEDTTEPAPESQTLPASSSFPTVAWALEAYGKPVYLLEIKEDGNCIIKSHGTPMQGTFKRADNQLIFSQITKKSLKQSVGLN